MNKNSYLLFALSIVLIITTSILLFIGPELIQQRLASFPKEMNRGEIGDAFGGTIGPIIAWIASIFTFAAFWVQFKANEQQKTDLQVERFENKFYNMVELLRQNVSEISIGKSLYGRKSFISMFDELRFIFLFTKQFSDRPDQKILIQNTANKEKLSEEEVFNISYLIFFFGIGQNSTKLVLSLIDKKYENFLLNLEEALEREQDMWRLNRGEISIEELTHEGDSFFKVKLSYKPFNGHLSRLSHYIRHLFQLIKFINDQPDEILNYEAKYEYASTVRAQLSVHEQLLLYYNSMSVLGKPWISQENDFLRKYCMIKSIPVPLADFYKQPTDWLPQINKNGKKMFEWSAINKRMNSI